MTINPKEFLLALFDTAVKAAQPEHCLLPYLPPRPKGRSVVIGFGKSAAAMARTVEENWDGPLSGMVLTRYGHTVPCKRIQVLEASHPVPDQAGIDGTKAILELVKGLNKDDLILCLISGGGSALFIQPPSGVTLEDKQALTQTLLKSGATIGEINKIRKRFSLVKGGRLAAACAPAKVVSLIISDVPGDDLSLIASGPTVPDPTSDDEVRAILSRYQITLCESMAKVLEKSNVVSATGDINRVQNTLIATPQMSLEAAAKEAHKLGVEPLILGDSIEGESRDVGKVMAGLAKQAAQYGQPAHPPCVLLSGGETTVTIKGSGKGGPNTEFLLSLAIALDGHPHIHALSCDTDGVDGSEDNAGAIIYPDTLARARNLGIGPNGCLANNDAYGFFNTLGDLVVPGPTLTNVNDFRAVLVTDQK